MDINWITTGLTLIKIYTTIIAVLYMAVFFWVPYDLFMISSGNPGKFDFVVKEVFVFKRIS